MKRVQTWSWPAFRRRNIPAAQRSRIGRRSSCSTRARATKSAKAPNRASYRRRPCEASKRSRVEAVSRRTRSTSRPRICSSYPANASSSSKLTARSGEGRMPMSISLSGLRIPLAADPKRIATSTPACASRRPTAGDSIAFTRQVYHQRPSRYGHRSWQAIPSQAAPLSATKTRPMGLLAGNTVRPFRPAAWARSNKASTPSKV